MRWATAALVVVSALAGAAAAGTAANLAGPGTQQRIPTALASYVKEADRLPTRVKGPLEVKILHDPENTGSQAASVSLIQAAAGADIPEHTHDESDELLVVLAGEGDMKLLGEAFTVKKGDVVRIPAGAPHALRVAADAKESLQATQVYAKAGPEQRFKQWERVVR